MSEETQGTNTIVSRMPSIEPTVESASFLSNKNNNECVNDDGDSGEFFALLNVYFSCYAIKFQ